MFLDNVTFEITPLQPEEVSLFGDHRIKQRSESLGEPHVVKRAQSPDAFFGNNLEEHYKSDESAEAGFEGEKLKTFYGKKSGEALTLELAVFFDEPGYNLFAPFFNRNDKDLRDMMLAYINAVQAIYHHPSLGIIIDISLVRLDIMQKQPRDLPHFDGDRSSLLDSFCN